MSIFDRLKAVRRGCRGDGSHSHWKQAGKPLPHGPSPESLAQMQALGRRPLTPLSDGGADRAGPVRLCR